MSAKLLFVHALTSLHAGTGQGVGTIDLPIARERATNLPVVFASSIKGRLRSLSDGDDRDQVFGKSDRQGDLKISDARLLLLPVRCAGSTFVWATSPYLLRRFRRDCELLFRGAALSEIPIPAESSAHMKDKSAAETVINGKSRLVLEDLDFEIQADPNGPAANWATFFAQKLWTETDLGWRGEFEKRFVVLHDADFDFLCETATEVNAHISIGENGTVEPGALWYEESLPAETVLVAILDMGSAQYRIPAIAQLGGNETTGQGLTRLVLAATL